MPPINRGLPHYTRMTFKYVAHLQVPTAVDGLSHFQVRFPTVLYTYIHTYLKCYSAQYK